MVPTIIFGASDASGVRLRCAKTILGDSGGHGSLHRMHRRTSATVRILVRQAVRELREATRPALPSPLWAVHFADRLAFGPVGLFLRSLHSRHLGAAGQRDDVSLTGGSYMSSFY